MRFPVELEPHYVLTVIDLLLLFIQSCLTLCGPTGCSTPGFPVLHHLPWVCSNSCPLSWWCHPTIISFSFCLQSFPVSGSFMRSRPFTSDGQSFSFSTSPPNEYSRLISFRMDWFPLLMTMGVARSARGLVWSLVRELDPTCRNKNPTCLSEGWRSRVLQLRPSAAK